MVIKWLVLWLLFTICGDARGTGEQLTKWHCGDMCISGSSVVFRVSAQQSGPVRPVRRQWRVDGTWPCPSPTICADSAGRPETWVWRRWHQLQVFRLPSNCHCSLPLCLFLLPVCNLGGRTWPPLFFSRRSTANVQCSTEYFVYVCTRV